MTSERAYHFMTQWSEEDATFVGLCFEFQGLAAHGPDHTAALEEIKTAVAESIMDCEECHEEYPKPSDLARDEIRKQMEARFKEPH